MIWASTVGNSLFNTRTTCPEKKKGARPDWTWLLSVCTRRLRSHIVLPKRKKMAVARHPLKNWTQFSCKYCLSFFHPINMTACHVSKNHPLFKRIELCNLLYFKAKLQKVRDLLGRQNNRLKCCKQQKKTDTDSLPFLALNIWDHYVVQGWMEASRAIIKSKKIYYVKWFVARGWRRVCISFRQPKNHFKACSNQPSPNTYFRRVLHF